MRRAALAESPAGAAAIEDQQPETAPPPVGEATSPADAETAVLDADTAVLDADTMRPATNGVPAVAATNGHGSLLLNRIDAKYASKTVIDEGMAASSREQYRRLAAALHHAREASGLSVVMIASAVAGEGKSLTASNLALTFSESYKRSVLLIDADLRRPSLHRVFGIEPRMGLSEALMAIEEPELQLIQVSERLTILPGGHPNSDPMSGLTSTRMQRLISEARELFDWVFIDTPPVGLLSDANLLAAMVDAAVMVIRADRTPFNLVQRAIDAIGRNRILGTVLNQATAQARGTYYEYYHYYQVPRGELTKG
jgi:capsular exopolysaccharide synthesis family protein